MAVLTSVTRLGLGSGWCDFAGVRHPVAVGTERLVRGTRRRAALERWYSRRRRNDRGLQHSRPSWVSAALKPRRQVRATVHASPARLEATLSRCRPADVRSSLGREVGSLRQAAMLANQQDLGGEPTDAVVPHLQARDLVIAIRVPIPASSPASAGHDTRSPAAPATAAGYHCSQRAFGRALDAAIQLHVPYQ